MKITSYTAIFQIMYVVHWTNLRILFLLESNKNEDLVDADNHIYRTKALFLYIRWSEIMYLLVICDKKHKNN